MVAVDQTAVSYGEAGNGIWNNYLAIMMFFSLNSSNVYYFPKNKGYKNYDLLTQLMRTNKKTKELPAYFKE